MSLRKGVIEQRSLRLIFLFGARETEVEEPVFDAQPSLFRSEILLQVEFDQIPVPKSLSPSDLRSLIQLYGSSALTADAIGASEAFVRQNSTLDKEYS